jgi:hypothetical protein
MVNNKCLFRLAIIFIFIFLFFVNNAYAYLDPGTGSYILQLIAASLFAGLLLFKNFWVKMREIIVNLFKRGGGN